MKKYILQQFKYGYCADESFIQMMALNSKYKERIYRFADSNEQKSILRYIQWEKGRPRVLGMDDYDSMINSGCLFARKFDESSPEIIDKICELVGR